MFKQIWKLFVEHIWPLLWPIVRDAVVDVVQDILAWIKKAFSDLLREHSQKQQDEAEEAADAARKKAETSDNHDDRIRAEAEAAAWQKIAEKLRKDNEELTAELGRVMQNAEKHAEDRIDSENVKRSTQTKVLSLEPPIDES